MLLELDRRGCNLDLFRADFSPDGDVILFN